MTFESTLSQQTDLIEQIGVGDAHMVSAIALFLGEADVLALAGEGITDGGGDKKIDFIYLDKDGRRIIFAQGYYATKSKDEAPANKASDLNTASAWLISGDLSTVPAKLKGIIEDVRQAVEDGEVDSIDLLYVHNLPESINVNKELQTVEGHLKRIVATKDISVRAHELGHHKIEELYLSQDSFIEIKDEVSFPSDIGIEQKGANWTAGVATVSGKWIHDLFAKYGDQLYSANYRGFLGADRRKRINSGIRETAEKSPSDFWAFNNGITILTMKMISSKNDKVYPYKLKGIAVINGAQTTGSIGSVDLERFKLDNVKILCRLIECSDKETIDKIVRFNNTQNVITTWDQFSNDADQKRIESEFAELGFAYNRKRGFSGFGDQIGIEQVLQPLLGFHGRPADAVRGKNQLFVQKHLYQNAFENKKARHILLIYALARAVDNKRLELKEKSKLGKLIAVEETQLNLLRNLNFKPFLLAVIANSLETIIGQTTDSLNIGFKPNAAKGAKIVELAARWVPVVESFLALLTAIVQPDTFFRQLSNDENFLKTVKTQMDAMLAATGAADKHKDFSELIAAT